MNKTFLLFIIAIAFGLNSCLLFERRSSSSTGEPKSDQSSAYTLSYPLFKMLLGMMLESRI